MTPFEYFIIELSKKHDLRKGFIKKRRVSFSISDERINELFDKYFSLILPIEDKYKFFAEGSDYDELVYILREHFRLWIEIKHQEITLHKDFPERFKIINEVNRENHWFIPSTIATNTIMYLSKDNYGVVNWLNGIPLTKNVLKDDKKVNPVFQINYDFITPIYN